VATSGAGKSYFVSVLLEELLLRKKEQGQIAVVAIDTHGEYTCFGTPVKQSDASKFTDFSSKTKIIDASKIKIACSKVNAFMVSSLVPDISPTQKRALAKIFSKLNEEMRSGAGPFDLNAIRAEIELIENDKTKSLLYAVLSELEDLQLFGKIDEPSIVDFVKPGTFTVIDLNSLTSEKKKQFIVAYISNKLFHERRGHSKKIPPFALLVEEAHNFIPEGTASEHAVARTYLRTIAREGRKFGASLVVISQRPKRLDTTTLANCNTNVILRITNPYDLKHISESCEGLDSASEGIISSLRVGEALIVGEAVSAPTFFKVRLRKSQPSRHEFSLEDYAKNYSADEEKKDDEASTFL
jgi:DNA helicase HerA-like ATPase